MRYPSSIFVALFALGGCIGDAAAQGAATSSDKVQLTQAQEQTILLRVEEEQPQSVQAPLQPGATAPEALSLKPLPSDVGAQIPEAERFHYAKVDDKVLLVDPANKQVVKVISQQSSILSPNPLPPTPGATTSGAR